MTSRSHLTSGEATYLARLPSRHPERVEAEAHTARCESCAAMWRTEHTLGVWIRDATPQRPALDDAMRQIEARVLREFDERSSKPSWSTAAALVVSAFTVGLVMLPFSRRLVRDGAAWLEASFGSAMAVVTLALSVAGGSGVAFALASSSLLTLGATHSSGWGDAAGLHCALTELASAVIPLGTSVWFAYRKRLTNLSWAAVAASGALAGQAALHLACGGRNEGLHLWLFHTGGVALAAWMGAMIGRIVARYFSYATA